MNKPLVTELVTELRVSAMAEVMMIGDGRGLFLVLGGREHVLLRWIAELDHTTGCEQNGALCQAIWVVLMQVDGGRRLRDASVEGARVRMSSLFLQTRFCCRVGRLTGSRSGQVRSSQGKASTSTSTSSSQKHEHIGWGWVGCKLQAFWAWTQYLTGGQRYGTQVICAP